MIMDGLNTLGRVPWKINNTICDVAHKCWDDGIVIGEIPSQVDFELPSQPIRPEGNDADFRSDNSDFQKYKEELTKFCHIHQKNMVRKTCVCVYVMYVVILRCYEM